MSKNTSKLISRRGFIGTSSAALAGLTIIPARAVSGLGHIAPSDKLNIAGVGIAGMGRVNLENVEKTENIVALCDVYDALRSPRSYKQAWSAERAQAYILENAGGHFDPHLVQVMSSVFAELEDLQLTMADRAEPVMHSSQHD